MMLEALLATLLTLAGVGGVRLAWAAGRAGGVAANRGWRIAGWGLLLLSVYPWMLAGGNDRGIALGLIVLMLAALCLVAWAGLQAWQGGGRRKARNNGNGRRNDVDAGNGKATRAASFLVFVLAGPVAGIIAILLTIGLHLLLNHLGVAPANRLAGELFFFPLAWVLLMMLACYHASLQQRTVVFGALLVIAAVPVIGVA